MQRPCLLLDDIIKYALLELVAEKTSKAIEKETARKDAPEITLEEEVGENLETPQINYSFSEEQFLMEQALDAPSLSYEKKSYKEGALSRFESEEYEPAEMVSTETETAILSSEEAKGVMVEIQYSAMLGYSNLVDPEKLEKLRWYIMTNSSMFKLMERICGISGDVNYSSLV